jgi:hypothetical protein
MTLPNEYTSELVLTHAVEEPAVAGIKRRSGAAYRTSPGMSEVKYASRSSETMIDSPKPLRYAVPLASINIFN